MYSGSGVAFDIAGDLYDLFHLCRTFPLHASQHARGHSSGFYRTARAKGLSERLVVYRHALRNSLLPIVTLMADLLPALIGGSVVIETIFSIPGMGQLGFQSVLDRDYPLIMAIFTLSALLTLLGILVADFLYTIVDPRIAYERHSA
jgi:peptide/nickel transport system permease protein